MKYKITINCTKEHLEKALYCGIDSSKKFHNMSKHKTYTTENCWIAVAAQEIFPLCSVAPGVISNTTRRDLRLDNKDWHIDTPVIVTEMINKFDECWDTHSRRNLKPFSFEIEFDQKTLETIMECNGFKSMQQFEEKIFAAPHLKLETV